MTSSSRAVYVISVAAELSGLHPQTLRNYERAGLLEPDRTPGRARRFSDADVARLARITSLTRMGVNIEGVRRILELEAEVEELRRTLAAPSADAPSPGTALTPLQSRTMVVHVTRSRHT
jgi:MerR family transcriptional regulator/heat shock protein HspR